MREFEGRGSRLARLDPASKWLYGSFNLLTVMGFISALALYWDSMGFSPQSAALHYLGNADDPTATEIILEKSAHSLWEQTHQHLFAMPVVMLVLGHLFLLSRGGSWKKGVVVAAPLLTAAHVAGPWIIWYGGSALGWWMPLTAIPFVGVYVFMALWPLPELFRGRPE